MQRKAFLTSFIPILCTSVFATPQAAAPKSDPISTLAAARYFQEAKWASDDDGGKMWGRPLFGPTILVDQATRFSVANQADKEGRLTAKDGVWVGQLPATMPLANTAVDWAGVKWSMVLAPLPDATVNRVRLLLHESWHRIQSDIGLPPAGVANEHLDTKDGRIWLRLEWKALSRALISWGAERKESLTDALIFRAYRRSLFPASAAAEEDRLEVHEGLAEYTGIALCGLANQGARWYISGRIKVNALKPSYTRSFAYETGPAYGLMLDMDSADWRKSVKPTSSLSGMLAEAAKIVLPNDLAVAAQKRELVYGSAQIVKEENQRDRERRVRIEAYSKLLVTGRVLELPTASAQYSFDPNEVVPMGAEGTVFPESQISDAWGSIIVKKGIRLSTDFKHAYVSTPTSADHLKGDGWELTLKPGWKVVLNPNGRGYIVTQ